MSDDDLQWYHIINTTYGAWLLGDPRGFRTRHHREHVEGDYKNPPVSGAYDAELRRSQLLLKQPPVVVPAQLRPVLGAAIREKLEAHGALVLCMSVSGQHVHTLAKVQRYHARDLMGVAMKHAWYELRDQGWSGKLFAKRGKELTIKDRAHQLNVYHYILRHAQQGAWVWSLVA